MTNELQDDKDFLLARIGGTLDFRAERATEHPQDANALKEITALYNYVEGLPLSHPLFKAIHDRVASNYEPDEYMEGETDALSMYGFEDLEEEHNKDEDPEAFVNWLIHLYKWGHKRSFYLIKGKTKPQP
jgi:hypothetical protein